MVDISKLTQLEIGMWVIYNNGNFEETGRIKSWNEDYIFVVFNCANKWHKFKDYTGASCDPKSLRFFEDYE